MKAKKKARYLDYLVRQFKKIHINPELIPFLLQNVDKIEYMVDNPPVDSGKLRKDIAKRNFSEEVCDIVVRYVYTKATMLEKIFIFFNKS